VLLRGIEHGLTQGDGFTGRKHGIPRVAVQLNEFPVLCAARSIEKFLAALYSRVRWFVRAAEHNIVAQ